MFRAGLIVLALGTLADAYSTWRALRWGAREANPVSRWIMRQVLDRGGSLKLAVFAGAVLLDLVILGAFFGLLRAIGAGPEIGILAMVFGAAQLVVARHNMRVARRAKARTQGNG